MSFSCRTCGRTNPPEALYCYFDGVALDAAHTRGPVAAGEQRFPTPFVMPSGRSCGSFDELVVACEADWDAARSVLEQGFLEGFLGGLGRVDLAMATRQAARSPDLDHGLDELLAKLPSTMREPAKLEVAQREIDLGEMPSGSEHREILILKNVGMGLLQGTVSCGETPWLALGDAPSGPQKMFHCRGEIGLPLHVVGKALRANAKPLQGKLVVESNGGVLEIPVRVSVPIKPFTEGVLAGANTPRQLAEKAKKVPRDAAELFASGAVAAWYEANGWTYPVQGPPATGLGAVQQFFEALGLVAAPTVTISTENVQFRGAPGAMLEKMIQIQTTEKRPVYAHAVSKSAWLLIGKVQLKGATAHIPLLIASVPSMPGEELQSRVEVAANGNQSFTVNVLLTITGGGVRNVRPAAAVGVGAVVPLSDNVAVPALEVMAVASAPPPLPFAAPPPLLPSAPPPLVQSAPPPPLPTAASLRPPPLEPRPINPPSWIPSPITETPPPVPAAPFDFGRTVDVEPVQLPVGGRGDARQPAGAEAGRLKHLLPLLLLALGLGGMLLHDYWLPARADDPKPSFDSLLGGTDDGAEVVKEAPIDPDPYLEVKFHDGPIGDDPEYLKMKNRTMRFGLVMRRDMDGKPLDAKNLRKLTYSPWGHSNNTCIRIDDDGKPRSAQDFLFGENGPPRMPMGKWIDEGKPLGKDPSGHNRNGMMCIWQTLRPAIRITQTVELIPSEVPPGASQRRIDTCLIRYDLVNEDTEMHRVGLRFLLDTYIGNNDGVPFIVPGSEKLCNTQQSFPTKKTVPDYIEALENDDPLNPGTVARVQFRLGKKLEAPSRVFLGGWPDKDWQKLNHLEAKSQNTLWEVPHITMRGARVPNGQTIQPDSAVAVYWNVEPLEPGKTRTVGFSYGLGSVSNKEAVGPKPGKEPVGKWLLTVGGRMARDSEFTLTALVQKPAKDEKLTLSLPDGLKLADGSEEQDVPMVEKAARDVSTVSWKIVPRKAGTFELTVKSSNRGSQKIAVTIRPRGVFD